MLPPNATNVFKVLINLSKEGETQKNLQTSSEPHIAAAVTKEFQKIYETAV